VNSRRVAIVTGAGQGIGRGIALELARNDFDIVGVDIVYQPDNTEKGLFEVKVAAEKVGAAFLPIQADISRLEDHQKIVDRSLEKFPRIDLLVNNAGVAPKQRLDILETTPESFDRLLTINTRGPFFLTQLVARYMVAHLADYGEQKPQIIFISSISAYVSSTARAEYCISKSAISMGATVFAHRLAEYGINVFELRPGIIQTDMTAVVKEKYDALIEQGLIPQKRWGFPEDIGRAVVGLAKGYFNYSTGLVAEVSGGMNIVRL